MSRAICPKCGNSDVSWIRNDADCAQYICLECKQGFYYPPKTVFDHITASPEVLAEAIVYEECEHSILDTNGCGATFPGGYTSAILDFSYGTKAEAIAATVAKLKEVCDE